MALYNADAKMDFPDGHSRSLHHDPNITSLQNKIKYPSVEQYPTVGY
jgi:hypothetical protein